MLLIFTQINVRAREYIYTYLGTDFRQHKQAANILWIQPGWKMTSWIWASWHNYDLSSFEVKRRTIDVGPNLIYDDYMAINESPCTSENRALNCVTYNGSLQIKIRFNCTYDLQNKCVPLVTISICKHFGVY